MKTFFPASDVSPPCSSTSRASPSAVPDFASHSFSALDSGIACARASERQAASGETQASVWRECQQRARRAWQKRTRATARHDPRTDMEEDAAQPTRRENWAISSRVLLHDHF
jgi:hypothetical protein